MTLQKAHSFLASREFTKLHKLPVKIWSEREINLRSIDPSSSVKKMCMYTHCIYICARMKCQRWWWWPIKIFYLFKSQSHAFSNFIIWNVSHVVAILSRPDQKCARSVHFMVIWMQCDTFMTATQYDKNYNRISCKLRFMVCASKVIEVFGREMGWIHD